MEKQKGSSNGRLNKRNVPRFVDYFALLHPQFNKSHFQDKEEELNGEIQKLKTELLKVTVSLKNVSKIDTFSNWYFCHARE